MKKQKTLYPLTLLLFISLLYGCGGNDRKFVESYAGSTSKNVSDLDTVRLIGVWKQPMGYAQPRYEVVEYVTKKGVVFGSQFYGEDGYFSERGDTIVVDGKGKFVKNLTRDRLAREFVKGK